MPEEPLKLPTTGRPTRRPMQDGLAVEVGRIPPQAVDAEKAVLGSCLASQNALAVAIPLLKEESFYHPSHRKIWRAFLTLFEQSKPVDLVTVSEHLRARRELDDVGGTAYLSGLDVLVTSPSNVEHYCEIVLDKSTLRKLVEVGVEIQAQAYDERVEAREQVDRAERSIFEIASNRLRTGFLALRALVLGAYSAFEEYHQKKVQVTGVPSGYWDLDEQTAGFQKSDFIVIAGRPSMGKTSFALNIAENVAVRPGKAERYAVGIFSLEMSKEALVQRMICSFARIDHHKVRRGYASHQEYRQLQDAAGKLHDAPVYIDDSAGIGILEIRAKARRLASMNLDAPLGMIIVDYLQLIRGPESENRQQEISAISRSLKALAKELQVPVVALSQLSRAVETRGGDKRPMLSDLRESGAIEQDADVVLFVYRPDVYETEPEKRTGIAEIIIAKQRNGPIGKADLAFVSECTRFDSLKSIPEPKF